MKKEGGEKEVPLRENRYSFVVFNFVSSYAAFLGRISYLIAFKQHFSDFLYPIHSSEKDTRQIKP